MSRKSALLPDGPLRRGARPLTRTSKLVKDRKNTDLLQQYWEANKAKKGGAEPRQPATGETPLSSPAVTFPADLPPQERKTHTRNRSASDGASLVPAEHKLSPYHPAWSLTSLLDKFGPLIFPIHRAALLRKRILISCHAPVHETCDFGTSLFSCRVIIRLILPVYDLSILSNIPLSLVDILPPSSPTQRLRPLFTIGVHDIPFLMEDFEASKRHDQGESTAEDEAGSGWIACTTDSILAMKDTLWDMLITIPPDYSANAKERVWPLVECPRGQPVKATQRDLRRFNALRTGLARLAPSASTPGPVPAPESPQSESESSAVRLSTSHSNRPVDAGPDDAVDKLVEPLSWTALAYNGFMWWASAGEQLRSEEQEESTRDAALLADLTPAAHTSMSMPQPTSRADPLTDSLSSLAARRTANDGEARIELAIIAYFHRLTTQILSVASDVVEGAEEAYADDDEEQGEDENGDTASAEDVLLPSDSEEDEGDVNAITVDSRSIENMGLDVWSGSDAVFVQELVRTYFGRPARIEGKGVEVCGVRVC